MTDASTTTADQDGIPVDPANELWGHPKGLYVCFATELWERFSFYGMRALLMFYLTQHFLFDRSDTAAHIYGSYFAMVYALPVFGGLLADRYLGFRKAVIVGGILLSLGHLGLAIEGSPAQLLGDGTILRDEFALQTFFLSISLIIVGVGFLKPNISTIVGRLYSTDDPRRDSGFTIFYMGINIGAASASLLCGYLGQTYGWKYGFGLAGIGMVIGLLTFLWGQKHLHGHAEPSNPAILGEKVIGPLNKEWAIYLGSVLAVLACWKLVQYHVIVGGLLGATSLLLTIGLIWFLLTKCNSVERHRMIVAMVLTFFSVFFWSLFEQAGSSMNLYADEAVNRTVAGMEIQASMFQSLNPTFIVLLGPLFAGLWIWMNKKNIEPSTPVKFGLGIVQVGLGFGALVIGASSPDQAGKVAMIWLVLAYFLHTTGELCLSPVGLSMITKLSVPRVVGLMMGTWFLATAGSEYLAAMISSMVNIETVGGRASDLTQALDAYTELYTKLGLLGVGVGILLILISPLLRKGMHGIH